MTNEAGRAERNAPNPAYLERVCRFMNSQEYLGNVSVDLLRTARTRDDLGISSLAVIMLVGNYMEARGVADTEFDADWVIKLDDVGGMLAVLQEIDGKAAARG